MISFQSQETTVAPAEKVWSQWTNVNQWPNWDTQLISAKLDSEFVPGASGELQPKTGPRSRFNLTEVIPLDRFTYKVPLPLAFFQVEHYLQTWQGQVLFTHKVSFGGPLGGLFYILLGNRFRAVLPEVLANLKRTVEHQV